MAGSRRKILGHVVSGLCGKMNRTKQMGSDMMDTPLKRCLNTVDLTFLGIGHMVGSGVYVLTGTVARDMAGPAIVLSFLLAGMVSLLAALCYAEFGARVPKAGSAYVYTYVEMCSASVARAWSGYVDSLTGGVIGNATEQTLGTLHEELLARRPDVLAAAVCLVYAGLLAVGVKASSVINSALTLVNMAVMGVVIAVGFMYAPGLTNWNIPGDGFLPFGFSGVLAGTATCFYAFVGFDSITTAGEETRDPGRSVPIAIFTSLLLVMVGYVLVSAALTLLVPFHDIVPEAALPHAMASAGLTWTRYAVSVGALCGMTTSLLGGLFALPRALYAMAADGLIFSCFARVNARTQIPLLNLAVTGSLSALLALFFDLEKLVEFMSIGTLMAYSIVSACVIILRYRPANPDTGVSEDELDDSQQPRALTGRLKAKFWWLRVLVGRFEPGSAVSYAVLLFAILSMVLCVLLQFAVPAVLDRGEWWLVGVVAVVVLLLLACLLVMIAHQQSKTGLRFTVPFVPLLPALSILCNIELMVHLNPLTWLRFTTWMVLESEPVSSYSVLIGSSEAIKGPSWGAIPPVQIEAPQENKPPARFITTDDKKAIIGEEEVAE
ncbi:hypothetical protein B566_EDAN010440 [Ephemera danica]|nr:hypothetical protein B566_EDAN010440 [Ephemera danica]